MAAEKATQRQTVTRVWGAGPSNIPNRSTHTMTSTVPTHNFASALLLVDAECNAAVDRRALRDAGLIQVRVLTSGLHAARLLAGLVPEEPDYRPDVVLCHKKMNDLEGLQLAELLRMHPRLLALPLLVVAGNNSEAERMDALASGFSGLLVRPYSQDALLQALQTLSSPSTQNLRRARSQMDTGAFDAALQQYEQSWNAAGSPDEIFKNGLQMLHDRDWDGAIQSFQRAMRQIALKGESELGLADAWRGKGDMRRYCHYLSEAGHTFARATQWHKARVAYARLLCMAPDAPSPFLSVAESLIRAGDFDAAAEALAAGYDLGPAEDAPDRLAQACLFTEDPEHSLEKMRRSLTESSLTEEAAALGNDMQESLYAQTRAAEARSQALRERRAAAHRGIAPRHDDTEPARDADGLADLSFLESLPDAQAPSRAGATPSRPAEYAAQGQSASSARNGARRAGTARQSGEQPVHLEPLRPFSESDAESTLFSSFPSLNEALTVAKVTWKLLRSSRR